MKKGTIVKLSQIGLDRIYPLHNSRRVSAEGKRFEVRGFHSDGSLRVLNLATKRHEYFAPEFIEEVK